MLFAHKMDLSNYYEILGISHFATSEEIRRAYRAMARKYHPDIAGEDARYMFDLVKEAYEVLSDTVRREAYDIKYGFTVARSWSSQEQEQAENENGERQIKQNVDRLKEFGESQPVEQEQSETLDSATQKKGWGRFVTNVGENFKQSLYKRSKTTPTDTQQAAETLLGKRIYKFTIDALEAIYGTTRDIAFQENGVTNKAVIVIPAGVRSGQVTSLRVNPLEEDQILPASIEATVTILGRSDLEVHGLNVNLHVPITISEAVHGAKIIIPTVVGSVKINIEPLSGQRKPLRVQGHGIRNETTGEKGDLFVIPYIVPPDRFSPAIEQALRACEAHYSNNVRAQLPTTLRKTTK